MQNKSAIKCVLHTLWLVPIVLVLTGVCLAADQSKPQFDIWEYRITGNTVLSNKQIEASVYPFLGPEKTFATVDAAKQSLGEAYRQMGYAFASVTIPEQSVDRGIVTLKVTEGELGRVRVKGNKYFSRKKILQQLPSLTPGTVPKIDEIKQELALLNRASSDRTVVPIAKQSKDIEGVDIDLKVKDELPLKIGFDYNNQNSPDTSDSRLGINFSYDNLFQRQHSLGIYYLTTPEDRDEVEVMSLNYSMPLPWADSRLSFYHIHSESDVATVGGINVLGTGYINGVSAIFPFFRPSAYHEISLGLESKDFAQSTFLSSGLTEDKPIDYATIALGYKGMISNASTRYSYGASLKSGLRGFGNRSNEFEAKRAGSKSNFAIFYSDLGLTHTMANEFQFNTRWNIQLSPDPLIGNEQFSAGGNNSVRGYLSSQELADGGYSMQTELITPEISNVINTDLITSLRFLGFIDYAKLHNRKAAQSGRDDSLALMGAGVGLRVEVAKYFGINLNFAKALKDSSEGSNAVQSGDWETHFTITGQY